MIRVLTMGAIIALSGCVPVSTGQQAAEPLAGEAQAQPVDRRAARRNALIAREFPNPADREGIILAFPIESGNLPRVIEIVWNPAEVSRAEIERRLRDRCASLGPALSGDISVRRELGTSQVVLPDGRAITTEAAFFDCDFAPRT